MAAGSNFSNLNNEFCGDDEFCDETLDDIDNVNIEDLVDGDVGILKDLVDEEPLSNESILEAWRHSARIINLFDAENPKVRNNNVMRRSLEISRKPAKKNQK